MNSSSIVRSSSDQPTRPGEAISAATTREYRRNRQHLYPLEDYQDALRSGGAVMSYCGIEVRLVRGNPADVVKVAEVEADDCITCLDIWLGRQWVRL